MSENWQSRSRNDHRSRYDRYPNSDRTAIIVEIGLIVANDAIVITIQYVIIEIHMIDAKPTIASTIVIEESNMVVTLVAEAEIEAMAMEITTINLVSLIIFGTLLISTKGMIVMDSAPIEIITIAAEAIKEESITADIGKIDLVALIITLYAITLFY